MLLGYVHWVDIQPLQPAYHAGHTACGALALGQLARTLLVPASGDDPRLKQRGGGRRNRRDLRTADCACSREGADGEARSSATVQRGAGVDVGRGSDAAPIAGAPRCIVENAQELRNDWSCVARKMSRVAATFPSSNAEIPRKIRPSLPRRIGRSASLHGVVVCSLSGGAFRIA